jgi:hypothetical protein
LYVLYILFIFYFLLARGFSSTASKTQIKFLTPAVCPQTEVIYSDYNPIQLCFQAPKTIQISNLQNLSIIHLNVPVQQKVRTFALQNNINIKLLRVMNQTVEKNNPIFFYIEAFEHLKQSEPLKAFEAFEKGLKEHPNQFILVFNYAATLLICGKAEEALSVIKITFLSYDRYFHI